MVERVLPSARWEGRRYRASHEGWAARPLLNLQSWETSPSPPRLGPRAGGWGGAELTPLSPAAR